MQNKLLNRASFFNLFFILLFFGCSAFYYKHKRFNKSFEHYDFLKAKKTLNSKSGIKSKGKDRLLYFLNNGVISHMMGDYDESNLYLEKAYKIVRNTRASIGKNILSFILNSTVSDYMGEDHEVLLINYYKVLNFIHLDDYDSALQECRRMDLGLRMLKAKYGDKATYKKDAFLYTLMGIIYQAVGEYNNAFYSYKNAVETYRKEYKNLFNIDVPNQLKLDLLHTAYVMGFFSDLDHYERLFDIKYDHKEYSQGSDFVCIWNNGLGPFKDSLNIMFVVNPAVGGLINFKNEELGLNFAFPIPPTASRASITDTSIFRIAFPKYVERKPTFTHGEIEVNNKSYNFEIVENINAISFAVLKQRMVWEFSKTLIRLFMKKIGEHSLSKVNEAAGLVYGIFNAVVEKADTRNWQTIPHSIYYNRIKLVPGEHELKIKLYNNMKTFYTTKNIDVIMKKGRTKFYILHTLETRKKL
ncbi:MAG: hypothetical protein GY830_00235 [Bacteroidetes bacterium]|nr:hypothetical protein [Bacteroidota bacterium]